jgi:sulfite reductase alpha subunit-like flavoprotein
MKHTFAGIAIVILIVLAVAAGGYASAKSYQFTGVVKAVDSNSLTVEKSAKETWQFELTKDTKGATPKIGDRVTISYRMTASEIETQPRK